MTTSVKRYFIKVFGCQMNEAEGEQLAAWYEAKGWRAAKSWQEADELVIYSCSVRESAENRVHGLVDKVYRWRHKEGSKTPKIILTGCMVGSAQGERRRYTSRQLALKLPHVDEFRPWWGWGFEKINPVSTRKDKKKALVPIMKGCNHFCSYCAVPYAKEKEISLSFEEIVCQVEKLVNQGWEEAFLLGQNVNSYGKDFSPSEKTHLYTHVLVREDTSKKVKGSIFALLLARLHEIEGLKKISFMSSNPWDLTDEIISAMSLPKIDRYLHLAVQSGDDEVLARMNRGYTSAQFFKLVEKLRKAIPEIRIGTDIIVGFPGESKEAFENTVKLCQKVDFDLVYVSKYSPRPGTAAFRLEDDVPHKEKQRRWRVINELVNC